VNKLIKNITNGTYSLRKLHRLLEIKTKKINPDKKGVKWQKYTV